MCYDDFAIATNTVRPSTERYRAPDLHSSHSSASSALSPLVYLAGIDGDFQRP